MFDGDGGSIRTTVAIGALTGQLGASLVADEVISIRSAGRDGVEVRAGGACSRHAAVVVGAGRRTAQLARGMGLSLPVKLAAHVRLTFALRRDRPPPPRLACLQDG